MTLTGKIICFNSLKTEMKLIIVENLQKLKMLFNVDCPSVKTVVLMNSKPDDEIPTKEGVKVVPWAEALKAEGVLKEARPAPDNLGELRVRNNGCFS